MKKTLYIIRGLPGSGKSTLGETLATTYLDYSPVTGGYKVHSYASDDYFYHDGVYKFDPDHLSDAHAQCFDRVNKAMTNNIENICVCNTFSQRWEAEPYFKIAKHQDYSAVVIECQNKFGSVHAVPQQNINRMKERWEPLRMEWPVMV